jgi:hypothetical protein
MVAVPDEMTSPQAYPPAGAVGAELPPVDGGRTAGGQTQLVEPLSSDVPPVVR